MKRTPANLTPKSPMFFVCEEFGSNEEMFEVTFPRVSVELIVCCAPEIGSEPATVAVVLIPTTEREAIWPV